MKLSAPLWITVAALLAGTILSAAAEINHQDMQQGAKALHDEMMSSCKSMLHSMPMEKDTDKMFAKMMADHHQSGIQMAEIELRFGNDPVLRAMAKKMAADQKHERAELLKRAAIAK